MGAFAVLAEAFRYPAPGRLDLLRARSGEILERAARSAFEEFLKQIGQLTLGEWEELYTRTLDLNPPVTPYLGYQRWGESYQRGNFMARMNRWLNENQIDLDGELPDHLIPIFRYLEAVSAPPGELAEVLEPALKRMGAALKKAEPENPYNHLFAAAQLTAAQLPKPAEAG